MRVRVCIWAIRFFSLRPSGRFSHRASQNLRHSDSCNNYQVDSERNARTNVRIIERNFKDINFVTVFIFFLIKYKNFLARKYQ